MMKNARYFPVEIEMIHTIEVSTDCKIMVYSYTPQSYHVQSCGIDGVVMNELRV